MFLEVALNLPINRTFTYRKPKEITDSIIGCRVIVPFKGRTLKAVVIKETNEEPKTFKALPINAIIDNEPIATEKEFELAKWMSEYYFCSFGEALFSCLPAGSPSKREKKVKPIEAKKTEYHDLNEEQEYALKEILNDLHLEKKSSFLLHGVTGSGKTEIYLQAIKETLKLGKQAIIILPEISLTPQTIQRFAERFEGWVAILHSKLSQTEKYRYWQLIRKNEIKIVVGARSAIFSPTKDLGIIVVDEEHESSYKSSDTPRYHARQIAFYRSEKENATLILGSATPSIETFYHAKENTKKVKLLSLTKRAASINMPDIQVVNMKEARKTDLMPLMSDVLFKDINIVLEKKEQVILFLNRKGYAPVVTCSHCKEVLECPHCSVTLTYHKVKDVVMCHYCGYKQRVSVKCEKCNIGNMEKKGFGTEKIEEDLKLLFPKAVVQRVDQETTKTPKAYSSIFSAFSKGQIDILIGTQMIAKGLDFPNVTLVGILLADSSLHIPDFRSSERTFNLITQVAGRSGRGDKHGKVIIQTYSPTHRSIETAQTHDYIGFYNGEIGYRQALNYPPFARLTRIVIRGINENDVIDDANKIADMLNMLTSSNTDQVEILGASECVMSKLKKYYRWNILIKSKSHSIIKQFLIELNTKFLAKKGNYVEIDVDPNSMV